MEDFTDEELLAELLAANPLPVERHGGITVQEYASARNISDRRAHQLLVMEMRRGRLYREWSNIGGRGAFVYYKMEHVG